MVTTNMNELNNYSTDYNNETAHNYAVNSANDQVLSYANDNIFENDNNINEIIHENVYLNEEEYIKSYLRCICAFKGVSRSLSPILHALCNYIEYDDEECCKVIHISGQVVSEVCTVTELKSARINKAFKELVDADIFQKIPHKRGMYKVSPCIVSKSEMKQGCELKASINFTKGCFDISIVS